MTDGLEPQSDHFFDTFTLFPHLLPELRILVWKYALLHPRLVLIYQHSARASPSRFIRRTVNSPLLSVCRESRLEALKYYFPPSIIRQANQSVDLFSHSSFEQEQEQEQERSQRSPLNLTLYSNSLFPTFLAPPPPKPTLRESKPFPIGPGSDIIYVSGSDPPTRRHAPITWTLTFLSQDLDSISPTISPIRHLAIDLELLLTTSFYKTAKFKMPYGIWKFIICDLKELESLSVVRSCSSCPTLALDGSGDGMEWGVGDIESKLSEAKRQFVEFWEEMAGCDGDESESEEEGGPREEVERLRSWRLPRVEVVGLEELVAGCWV